MWYLLQAVWSHAPLTTPFSFLMHQLQGSNPYWMFIQTLPYNVPCLCWLIYSVLYSVLSQPSAYFLNHTTTTLHVLWHCLCLSCTFYSQTMFYDVVTVWVITGISLWDCRLDITVYYNRTLFLKLSCTVEYDRKRILEQKLESDQLFSISTFPSCSEE